MVALPAPSWRRCRQCLLTAIILAFPLMAASALQLQAKPVAQTAQAAIFLPLIVNDPAVGNPKLPWPLNEQEKALETLFRGDSEQHRVNPSRNDILSQVARARAQDMVDRDYFSHTDPDGHQANFLVEQAGYTLPDFYPDNGNNIESIGLNYTTAAEQWQAWKNSPAHRTHVLGEDPFFQAQIEYGFGYAEDSDSRYWVIITARH